VITASLRRGGELLAVGTVRGIEAEVGPLVARLEEFAPTALAVGISFDELTGLNDHFVGRPSEPLVPLTPNEAAEVKGLSKFGDVSVPNPSILGALEWAAARSVPVEAVDPSDETYATLFTRNISYLELVRRTIRERRLAKDGVRAATADEFATRWHTTLTPGAGSRRFDAAREEAVCEATESLLGRFSRVALLVDRERFDAVVARMRGGAPARGAARPTPLA
jgi:hypothetical protein